MTENKLAVDPLQFPDWFPGQGNDGEISSCVYMSCWGTSPLLIEITYHTIYFVDSCFGIYKHLVAAEFYRQ